MLAQTGDAGTVAELLGRGAKLTVSAKNNAGATPLHVAAKLGHLRIARDLLAVGARADAKDAVSSLAISPDRACWQTSTVQFSCEDINLLNDLISSVTFKYCMQIDD